MASWAPVPVWKEINTKDPYYIPRPKGPSWNEPKRWSTPGGERCDLLTQQNHQLNLLEPPPSAKFVEPRIPCSKSQALSQQELHCLEVQSNHLSHFRGEFNASVTFILQETSTILTFVYIHIYRMGSNKQNFGLFRVYWWLFCNNAPLASLLTSACPRRAARCRASWHGNLFDQSSIGQVDLGLQLEEMLVHPSAIVGVVNKVWDPPAYRLGPNKAHAKLQFWSPQKHHTARPPHCLLPCTTCIRRCPAGLWMSLGAVFSPSILSRTARPLVEQDLQDPHLCGLARVPGRFDVFSGRVPASKTIRSKERLKNPQLLHPEIYRTPFISHLLAAPLGKKNKCWRASNQRQKKEGTMQRLPVDTTRNEKKPPILQLYLKLCLYYTYPYMFHHVPPRQEWSTTSTSKNPSLFWAFQSKLNARACRDAHRLPPTEPQSAAGKPTKKWQKWKKVSLLLMRWSFCKFWGNLSDLRFFFGFLCQRCCFVVGKLNTCISVLA